MNIELRHLRAFVSVAEELQFRRAAERLHIGQPALSRTIQWLEQEIGTPLFRRTTRNVDLTEAGHAFLGEARHALQVIDRGAVQARRAAEGAIGHLTVAYMDFAILGPLPGILEQFRRRHPGVTVDLTHMPTSRQRSAIAEGAIDIGFLIGPFQAKGFSALTVNRERHLAVLPRRHRLAGKPEIALPDLSEEPFVLGSTDFWRAYRAIVGDLCLAAGFQPRIVQEASTSDGIFGLVGARMGVTLYPECARTVRRPGLTLRPLTGIRSRVPTVAVWRKTIDKPVVSRFVEVLRDAIDSGAPPR